MRPSQAKKVSVERASIECGSAGQGESGSEAEMRWLASRRARLDSRPMDVNPRTIGTRGADGMLLATEY
eukprot:765715-Hanusia_phi.AAC.3